MWPIKLGYMNNQLRSKFWICSVRNNVSLYMWWSIGNTIGHILKLGSSMRLYLYLELFQTLAILWIQTGPHLAYMSTRVLPTTFKLHLFKTLERFFVMPMFSISWDKDSPWYNITYRKTIEHFLSFRKQPTFGIHSNKGTTNIWVSWNQIISFNLSMYCPFSVYPEINTFQAVTSWTESSLKTCCAFIMHPHFTYISTKAVPT